MAAKGKKKKRTSTRVTLEDIARYCDVSKATVSRVLNDQLNEFPVSEEMIARVKGAAEQLGYRPNRLARAIRNQRTGLIGLSFIRIDYQNLTADQFTYENQLIGQYTNCILSHPGFKDYDLVIHDREETLDRPLKEGDFKTELLEGMIYLMPSVDHREFIDIASTEFPIVLLGQVDGAEEKLPCIDINNRAMACKAVEHLFEIGRKNVMLLIPEELQHINCIQDRIKGYHDAMALHDRKAPEEFVRTVRSLKSNVEAFFANLRCIDDIDAIFCPADDLAMFCLPSLQALGKKVPEEIAVIGFTNMLQVEHTNPQLSSVQYSVEAQATMAIDLLLKVLKKEIPFEPGFHEIEAELVIRGSTQVS